MIRLLKFLFTGDWHLHQWETHQQAELTNGKDETVGVVKFCCCKHCGSWKRFNLQ